jgi:DNA-binding winged helix-turn-helix (wHTH) protein/tetratricopeptide (TPR) repeat protein
LRSHRNKSNPGSKQFRFDGVELDVENVLLRVDGRERACSSKVFDLLQLLCREPGKLISRQELLDALWPGGQVVSDDALTKVIFRTRAVLGPYGGHIRTVRGLGLRLAAEVSALDGSPAEGTAAPANGYLHDHHPASVNEVADFVLNPARPSADSPEPAAATTMAGTLAPSDARSRMPWRIPVLASIAALLMVVGYLSQRASPAGEQVVIDRGYGLMLEDLHAEWPGTAAMVADALRNDAVGERDRGIALLEAVHEKDTRTPVAALFLGLWASGVGKTDRAERWLEQARQRIGGSTDVYLNLLFDYIAAVVSGSPEQEIYQAGALLDIRPDAWRMHHARAHLMEYLGMREAALREIQQIEVTEFGERKRDLTIADRASFGDVAGAQAILDRLTPVSAPAVHAFLSGRVAWSRGDYTAAYEHLLSAAPLAYETGRVDLYRRALIYAGALEAMWGMREEAIATLERARTAIGEGSIIDAVDVTLLLSQLHAEAGRFDQMNAELERALAAGFQSPADNIAAATAMAAWRLRPDPAPVNLHPLPPESEALWRAMEAHASGQRELAIKALAEARALGVGSGRMADEARWLELQLGLPVSPEPVLDPPYPPISRVVLRRQIREILEERGESTGPLRP